MFKSFLCSSIRSARDYRTNCKCQAENRSLLQGAAPSHVFIWAVPSSTYNFRNSVCSVALLQVADDGSSHPDRWQGFQGTPFHTTKQLLSKGLLISIQTTSLQTVTQKDEVTPSFNWFISTIYLDSLERLASVTVLKLKGISPITRFQCQVRPK